jgi:hypothetical protein
MLELQDGIKTKSQARIQDEVNLHNQKRRSINVNWIQMVQQI